MTFGDSIRPFPHARQKLKLLHIVAHVFLQAKLVPVACNDLHFTAVRVATSTGIRHKQNLPPH